METSYSMTKRGDGVVDRGSVVIGGGEARSCYLFTIFYCFLLKLKYFVFIFSLILSTCVYFIAL